MAFRKRSKSLDHFDNHDEKKFKPHRVVSYKLFAQEQQSRLTTFCPFLTQEQIALKVKEKWNRMTDESKQNYTKAVLYATPNRKTVSPKSPRRDSLNLSSKDKAVNSKAKVTDWLNDVKRKQSKDVEKTYESSTYALQYDVPTVIDPTPSKQPGILKTGSSEKKENEKSSGKKTRRSRVSFTNGEEIQSIENKTKTKLESKFTNLNDSFNSDDKNGTTATRSSHPINKSKQEGGRRRNEVSNANLKGIVFEEKVEDELFTTPEMAKLPLQEISKAPRKRKTSGNSNRGRNSSKSSKAKKVKVTDENDNCEIEDKNTEPNENQNNNNQSIESDVFGKKPWAASTYTRKLGSKRFTPEKSKKFKEPVETKTQGREERYPKRKGGAITGPVLNDNEGSCSQDSEDFHLDNRGLIVGPIGFTHNEDFEEEDLIDEDSEEENVEIEKKKQIKKERENIWKKKVPAQALPKKEEPKKQLPRNKTNRNIPQKKSSPNKKKVGRTGYKSDFDIEEDNSESEKQSQVTDEDAVETKKTRKTRKSRDKINVKEVEASPTRNSSNSYSDGSGKLRCQLVSLCEDFSVQKPVSPIISEAGDSNMSNTSEKSSPVRPSGGGNPTLMKVLLKMKQITSPSILDFGEEESPKLLSPALSGISELSSLSTTSTGTDMKSKVSSLKQEPKREKEVKTILSKRVKRSIRPSSGPGQENILCSMFQDLTPPEVKNTSTRRLVSSNRNQQKNNFSAMFEDEDIFR